MTTHVFIVDTKTFKHHLEYLFVGTGMKELEVDFNKKTETKHHYARENTLMGLIADFFRVKIDDLVIFYLQQDSSKKIDEGKFYGVFQIKSLVFLDNNDGHQFLKRELDKSLLFRCLIKPYDVYSEGITEWEALDEIQNIESPNQMLWSLIYRKLKGNRGNTMITSHESQRLINLIKNKNNGIPLHGNSFNFDMDKQKIIVSQNEYHYSGRQESIDILPRLISKHKKDHQFEVHLQAYILQNFCKSQFFDILNIREIEWLGNEVSCGVGMQRIDILACAKDKNSDLKKIIPIELKSTQVYPDILKQIKRYLNWLKQYYMPNIEHPSCIQPIIICKSTDKDTKNYQQFEEECKNLVTKDGVVPPCYIEFSIKENSINFEKIF